MSTIATTPTTPTKASNEAGPVLPFDVLMNLIIAFLAPVFLSASGGNIAFARMAARETVNAYRIENQADLLSVAQVIGFGLAALSSLSLSMEDGLSLSMTLRLRGNAVSLNRAAERNRRALKEIRPSSASRNASIAPSAGATRCEEPQNSAGAAEADEPIME